MKLRYWFQKVSILALIASIAINRRHIFFGVSPFFKDFHVEFLYISLYLADLVAILVILGCLGLYFTRNTWLFKGISPHFALLFGWICAIYLFLPRETIYTYYYFGILIMLFALALAVSKMFSHETPGLNKLLLNTFAFIGVGETLIAFFQFSQQKSVGLWFLGETRLGLTDGIAKIDVLGNKLVRPYGTFAHPNLLAAFLIVACATSLLLLIQSRDKKYHMLYLFLLLINTFGLVLTFSRAGLLGWLVYLIIFCFSLYIKFKKGIKNFVKPMVVAFLALGLSVLILSPYLKTRATINDASSVNRLTYDKIGLELIKKSPWVGLGLGNSIPEVAKNNNFAEVWQIQPPHNYFILVACETGVIGLALTIIFFGSLIYKKTKMILVEEGDQALFSILVNSVFISFLFLMMFDHYFYDLRQTQILLWFWVGLMLAKSNKID